MDFEKMYKEALERARRLNVDNMLSNEAIEEIFPELRESEDERIRKELKEAFEAYGDGTRPMLLSNEWIVNSKVHEICEKNGLLIDFSRKRKLKISIVDKDGKIIISYFYPMPMYVHELQHILRYFNRIEL